MSWLSKRKRAEGSGTVEYRLWKILYRELDIVVEEPEAVTVY
jgi:hypothetical protein